MEISYNLNFFATVIFSVGATLTPIYLLPRLEKHYKKKEKQLLKYKEDNNYYHCIFFTLNNKDCRKHILNYTECSDKCSYAYLETLLKLISSAKISIRICQYMLTLKQVQNELVKASQRNINIKIITDFVTLKMDFLNLNSLNAFEVKSPLNEDTFMHHKFCVIDAEDSVSRKMFLGSANLTLQGITANLEFIVITNDAKIIQRYSEEYDFLWDKI